MVKGLYYVIPKKCIRQNQKGAPRSTLVSNVSARFMILLWLPFYFSLAAVPHNGRSYVEYESRSDLFTCIYQCAWECVKNVQVLNSWCNAKTWNTSRRLRYYYSRVGQPCTIQKCAIVWQWQLSKAPTNFSCVHTHIHIIYPHLTKYRTSKI